MEDNLSISAELPIFCDCCNAKVNQTDAFCDNCGYPLKGTEQEQMDFRTQRTYKEIDLIDYDKQIKRAGNSLYLISIFMLAWGLILYSTTKVAATFIVSFILAAIFLSLGIWSRKKPLTALISGAALYGILIILSAVVDPISIVSGIIWKILIIGAFIRGIKSAIEAEKVKKELNIS